MCAGIIDITRAAPTPALVKPEVRQLLVRIFVSICVWVCVCMHVCIYSFMHLSIYLIYRSFYHIYWSIYLSIWSVYLSVYVSMYLCILCISASMRAYWPIVHRSIDLSIYHSIDLSTHRPLSIFRIYLSFVSIYLSIYLHITACSVTSLRYAKCIWRQTKRTSYQKILSICQKRPTNTQKRPTNTCLSTLLPT
jgi:hypothetical protein